MYASCFSFEPSHEIMALFDLHKLILQTRMRSHPMGLDVWFLVRPFVYFHTSCEQIAKALVRLRRCAGSPEPSLVVYVISTIISWADSFVLFEKNRKVFQILPPKSITCSKALDNITWRLPGWCKKLWRYILQFTVGNLTHLDINSQCLVFRAELWGLANHPGVCTDFHKILGRVTQGINVTLSCSKVIL